MDSSGKSNSNLSTIPMKRKANGEPKSTPAKRRSSKKRNPMEDANRNLPIFQLEEKLLTKIVNMIPMGQWPSMESISRRFREIIYKSWNEVKDIRLNEFRIRRAGCYEGFSRYLDVALRKFVRRAPNITAIDGFYTRNVRSLRRPSFRSLAKFEYLDQIAFGCDHFFDRNLEFFLETAACRQRLKILDMSKVHNCSPGHELDEEIGAKGHVYPLIKLDKFIGSIGNFITAERFFKAATLKELILMKDDKWAEPNQIITIIQLCRGLEKLEFYVSPYCHYQQATVRLFTAVAALENLSELKMGNAADPKHRQLLKSLIHVLGRHGRISSIAITCDDEIIQEIAQYLPFLKSVNLNVADCTAASLIQLITQMQQLESLQFRGGYESGTNVNGEVMQAIVDNLNGLTNLGIENPKCESQDFNGLVDLPLKKLRIESAKLETATVEMWAQSGLGSRLEALELINYKGTVAPNVMTDLINQSVRLRRLHLSKVTNGIVNAIANSCPLLTELTLTQSGGIFINPVRSVIDRCLNMKILRLSFPFNWDRRELFRGKYCRRVQVYWEYARDLMEDRPEDLASDVEDEVYEESEEEEEEEEEGDGNGEMEEEGN